MLATPPTWHKYVCPYCGKVLAVGEISGIIKCKKCGKLTKVEYTRVQPTGGATPIAR